EKHARHPFERCLWSFPWSEPPSIDGEIWIQEFPPATGGISTTSSALWSRVSAGTYSRLTAKRAEATTDRSVGNRSTIVLTTSETVASSGRSSCRLELPTTSRNDANNRTLICTRKILAYALHFFGITS